MNIFCFCGCNNQLSKYDSRGRERKYIHGHNINRKGKKHSKESKLKIRKARKRQIFTIETRLKMSESRRGSKNHFWRGGIYPESLKIRASLEYRLWRKSILERDNFQCINCSNKENLEVDHIKSFSKYPELRFDLNNGRTLCKDCHRQTDNYGWRSVYA